MAATAPRGGGRISIINLSGLTAQLFTTLHTVCDFLSLPSKYVISRQLVRFIVLKDRHWRRPPSVRGTGL